MKKPLIALLLILGSAFPAFSYSQVLACVGGSSQCTPTVSVTPTVYQNFRCFEMEDKRYELCTYGDNIYFCLKGGGVNKECVLIK
jgi:hypothetical protein